MTEKLVVKASPLRAFLVGAPAWLLPAYFAVRGSGLTAFIWAVLSVVALAIITASLRKPVIVMDSDGFSCSGTFTPFSSLESCLVAQGAIHTFPRSAPAEQISLALISRRDRVALQKLIVQRFPRGEAA